MSILQPRVAAIPDTSGDDAILEAVVSGAREFLNRADWSGALAALLERLGTATRSHHVRVFANDEAEPGAPLRARVLAEWLAPGRTARSAAHPLQRLGYAAAACARWESLLSTGEPVVGLAAELPEPERRLLRGDGAVSVALVPVFVGSRWWGFIGFSDCERPRRWTEPELNALFAAASILGAAQARREMEQRVALARTQERLAAEIGEAVTAGLHGVDEIVEHCAAAVARHVGADIVRIWVAGAVAGVGTPADVLVARHAHGTLPIALDVSGARLGEGAVGRIAERRIAQVWRDDLPELWAGSRDTLDAAGLTAGAGLPLISGESMLGVVVILLRQAPSPAQLETLGSVTDDIAVALQHAHARVALQRGEERYRRLVDATVEGIVIHDGRRIIDANPSVAAMTGYALDDIIGRDPFDFVDPGCHAEVRARLAASYPHPYEAAIVHRDGTVFPVEMKGSDFVTEGTRLRIAAIRDIRERKAAEQSARRLLEERTAREAAEHNRQQAEFLVEASRILASSFDTSTTLQQLAQLCVPDLGEACIVSLIENGELTHVAEVHAPHAAELPGRDAAPSAAADTTGPARTGNVPPRVAGVPPRVAAVQSLGLEFTVPVVDGCTEHSFSAGEERALLHAFGATGLLSSPIRSGGELIGSILLVARAPRAAYEATHLALVQELGRRAAVAVQGARSYHDAQAAIRARDDMLAVVAHDLRNPLNTIIMGSDLALEMTAADAPSPARRQLEIIMRTAHQMNRLIQDLLDTTRLQAGQLALELATVRPESIVHDAVELLQPLAAHAGVAFRVEIPEALPPVRADSGRLLQALSNLVGNAIKFTPRGGSVTLGVGIEQHDAWFRVCDTGPGISEDQLPHIFGRFWQARSTDRRGLGLGLAIAKGIVEAHGGSMRVDSRPGEGSTFSFSVPLAAEPVPRAPLAPV